MYKIIVTSKILQTYSTYRFSIMIKILPGVFPSFEVVTIFDVELVVVPVIFDIGVP